MILVRYVSETGETIDIVPERFEPLSYSDLAFDSGKGSITYPFEIDAKSIEMLGHDNKPPAPGRVSIPIKFHQPLSVFALVDGGWLPPPFVIPSNFLVDRNVVSSLVRIRRGVSTVHTDWWFQFFNEFTALINPGLYAFEGKELRPPSFDEFRNSFDEASKEIASQLPGAKLVPYGAIQYKAAYDMLLEFSDRYDRETKFLMKVAPKVTFRPTNSHISQTEAEILETAAELGLKTHSLAVIAILACLYERADGSGFLAARRIIKPGINYAPQDAHNALADLRALEIFISGVGLSRAFRLVYLRQSDCGILVRTGCPWASLE